MNIQCHVVRIKTDVPVRWVFKCMNKKTLAQRTILFKLKRRNFHCSLFLIGKGIQRVEVPERKFWGRSKFDLSMQLVYIHFKTSINLPLLLPEKVSELSQRKPFSIEYTKNTCMYSFPLFYIHQVFPHTLLHFRFRRYASSIPIRFSLWYNYLWYYGKYLNILSSA